MKRRVERLIQITEFRIIAITVRTGRKSVKLAKEKKKERKRCRVNRTMGSG